MFQSVGCDNVLGSTKREDECGLCGGDGSTCKPQVQPPDGLAADQPVTFHWLDKGYLTDRDTRVREEEKAKAAAYVWRETEFSECSVSCGVGNSHFYSFTKYYNAM
jgi:hypothetical protein